MQYHVFADDRDGSSCMAKLGEFQALIVAQHVATTIFASAPLASISRVIDHNTGTILFEYRRNGTRIDVTNNMPRRPSNAIPFGVPLTRA